MKKIFAILILALAATTASAHGYYRGGGYYGGNAWIAPLVIGAGVGYLAARPYYAPPPQVVYVQQPPVYVQPQYQIPPGYHQEVIQDSNCNCYRAVLVPN